MVYTCFGLGSVVPVSLVVAGAGRGAVVVDVVVSWSVLPATATEAGISRIDGRGSGMEDPNPGWPGRGWPYSGPDPRALVTYNTQLATDPPPVPHSLPVDAGVGCASAAATAAATSSRTSLRTAASDSGASPPAGCGSAGADEGGGEARSHSVMVIHRKMKCCQHKLRMMPFQLSRVRHVRAVGSTVIAGASGVSNDVSQSNLQFSKTRPVTIRVLGKPPETVNVKIFNPDNKRAAGVCLAGYLHIHS